jgi:hypothetical protein
MMIPAAGCHNLIAEQISLIAGESEDSTKSSQSASAEESGESHTTHQSAGQLDVDVDEEDDTESDAEEETEINDENDTTQKDHRDGKTEPNLHAVRQFPQQRIYPAQSPQLPRPSQPSPQCTPHHRHSSQQSLKPSTAEKIPFDLDMQFQDDDTTRDHDEDQGGDSESERGDDVQSSQGTPGSLSLPPSRHLEPQTEQPQQPPNHPQTCSEQLINHLPPQQQSPQSQQVVPTSRQSFDDSVEVYAVYKSGESDSAGDGIDGDFNCADDDNEGDISQQSHPDALEL